ncbi:hypothetical protein TpMuguga_04g00625 [Theileria parva strain Muguga]|uniref:uncharacterized protein n=1 Tax=Theileria parva strain Muguga TaxID=333668 RepID=UPI001C61E91A|nr:uncharacterized protein TpMuguga_04g00625 [Theileria parva strain Muguga]EAN31977.2 hypothetical protein TpMuguga_04g00625 [Theileria parva strain Muguga]
MKVIDYIRLILNIHTCLYVIAKIDIITCKQYKFAQIRSFSELGKMYNTFLLCENLPPESVNMNTFCMSQCGTTYMDEGLKCNPQAETWKIRLKVDRTSTYFETGGCKPGQRRFKCVPYKSNEGECDDESALVYPKGYSCFTKCGVKTCPTESFKKPTDVEDLKIADCTNGFRVRCSFNASEESKEVGTGNLTLELKTKSSKI